MKKFQLSDYMPVMFTNHSAKKNSSLDDIYIAKRVIVDNYDTEGYSLYRYHKPIVKCIENVKSLKIK